MKPISACAFLGAFAVAISSPLIASAGSALSSIPIGRTTTYHVTTQAVTESGPQSTSHYVKFTHTAPTSFSVSVDGAPGQTISIGPGGLSAPPQLKNALKPFAEIGLLLRGAPQPASVNASWTANLPVPVEGNTDNVPVTMTVTQASHTHATIVGSGGNSTDVRPGVRQFPTDVSVTSNIGLGPNFTIASATSNVSIVVHVGRLGRDKKFSSSWTISAVNQ
jgi:hypothetical protein